MRLRLLLLLRRLVQRAVGPRRVERGRVRRRGRRGDGRDEVLRAGARGLDVLGAQLERVFELRRHVAQLAAQQEDDIAVVLTLLVLGLCRGAELLQALDAAVQRAKVLLDDVGQLVDFDGPVVEQRFPPCELCEPFELGHRCADAP